VEVLIKHKDHGFNDDGTLVKWCEKLSTKYHGKLRQTATELEFKFTAEMHDESRVSRYY